MPLLHENITGTIIASTYEVYNTLGYGFLEKVYQRAMQTELESRGLSAQCEFPIQVSYKNTLVGNYFADLFVAETVIVELKVSEHYNSQDEAQLLNELKATGVKIGMLINFRKYKVEFKRLVY